MQDMLRCDLQVHSLYSDRPSEWILRKLGVPESYTRPADIYERLRSDGFELVTITDHNRIDGCLEIADREGVFLSEKVTAYFPEDHCKVHILVWNLNEAQHRAISLLRRNIYELVKFLGREGLAHGVSYPLTSVNGLLTPDHVEKLLLLFRVFDGVNLSTGRVQQDVFRFLIASLTPEKMQEMAQRHGIEPVGDRPWEKVLFGGSDDHAGLYIGRCYTELKDKADGAPSAETFFKRLMAGEIQAVGEPGDMAHFASGIYQIIFSYAGDRLAVSAPNAAKLLRRLTERFLSGENPAELSFSERIGHVVEAVRTGKALDLFKPNDLSLNRELTWYFLNPRVKLEIDEVIRSEKTPERRSFRVASKIANDLIYRLFQRGLEQVHRQNYLEALQPASGLLPVLGSVLPYVFSFHHLHGNRELWRRTARRIVGKEAPCLINDRRAWFTDTLEDVNGVARTIRTMGIAARDAGRSLTIVSCRSDSRVDDVPLKNFIPVGEFELPEYKLQKLSFPPILDMIDYVEREGIQECIISTPGPVGVTALAAAKLMGLRTVGIYHTDFPQYVRILTEDEVMETMMWNYMHWFYSQMDLLYVNSQFYKDCWVRRGIRPEKIKILPRGLDTELFHHGKRKKQFWQRRGAMHPVLLYVGRVSKEKELEFLCRVMEALKAGSVKLDLAVVGDGPYLDEMKENLPEAIFTGILNGEELAMAYASADLFVFPSTTDTFGNVVIEALSSGLPAYVSDVGGPCELVRDGRNGRVLRANDLDTWVNALTEWAKHPTPMEERMAQAEATQQEWNWTHAFERFWQQGFKDNEN